ncbi:L-seryl-tRNA(Sec) selenium transferase [Actinosynnema sp. NPDC020468]|uniref:L-seryl-tRNA(Sec) selenium transferase n=1 Tax=Actinosynnema sp. NPDC020468 TaxID=3154488 RepID=UPI0034041B97
MTDPRRLVPRTDAVLASPRLADALRAHGRAAVKAAIVAAQHRIRAGEVPPDRVVDEALAGLRTGPTPVLNATGVLVHTNLGRAPLSAAARDAVVAASGATDVEFDLRTGVRRRRGESTLDALRSAVPDAGDVHVVNNNAAALLLCALVLAAGREIVVSRGELVEIGDGFRIPDLLSSSGARLREVGTTNRTAVRDYADAVGPDTGFVLRVHPSNYRVTGFAGTPEVAELTGLGVPLVVDVGSGLLRPHPALPDEPDATSVLRAGATLVTASADKLLGGPQAGLLLGEAALVERLRRHPAARALRVDKLTLAALEATVRGPRPPVVEALEAEPGVLRERAVRMAEVLAAQGVDVEVVPSVAVVGGGGAPGVELPSTAVGLPERYAAALRLGAPPVVGRVERGRCLLDLRTLAAADDDRVVEAVLACR